MKNQIENNDLDRFYTVEEVIDIISRKSKMLERDHMVESLKYLRLQWRVTFGVLLGLFITFGIVIIYVL